MFFIKRVSILLTVLLCLVFASPTQGSERRVESGKEIVASVLKAYGGSKAVGNVFSVMATGRIAEFMNGKSGSYARFFDRTGKLRIEVMPEQGGEIRILNGKHGWQKVGEGFAPVSNIEIRSMIYQYSYLDLPMGLIDGEFQAEYGGIEQHNGREMYLLLIAPKHAPPVHVLIDPKTRLIVRVAANFAMGMMGSSELATEYSDYRIVGGVLFPYKLTNFAGDTKLSEIVLSDIQLNRRFPESLFTPE